MAKGAEDEPMAPDKHFDQLLAQQRELISEDFEQPDAPPGGSVTADQPRVW
jgi:hypothetical protein